MSRVLTAAIAAAVLVGCGGSDAVIANSGDDVSSSGAELTWTQFLSRIHQVPDQDLFIVNGDTTIEGWKNLRAFYEVAVLGSQKLIIDTWTGVDSKWNDTQKLNLSYCVSNNFGTRKAAVVTAMANAAGAWEAATNIKYVYVPAQDGSCTIGNNNVLFDVRPVSVNGSYLARSFFPGDSRSARSLEIDGSAFTTGNNPTLTGLLRHELGHTLGFRHEHTRPEAGSCFEDNSWRALTTYDSNSVMHYPQCNGTGDWTLQMTAKDIAGAKLVYGNPAGGTTVPPPPPPPTSSAVEQTFGGTVAKGGWSAVPAIAVKPGTTFTAVLSGSGDPDLYVRVGSAPTATKFTCRPYLDGANETCSITVSATGSQVFVSINGYTASTFSVKLTWTQP
jgi:serine protease